MQVDADDDDGTLLAQALEMSMMDGDEAENMRIAMEMSMAPDTSDPPVSSTSATTTTAAAAAQPPAPTPPPASSGASANPPPAPAGGDGGGAAGAGEFFDPSFVQSLLDQIPNLDPKDPRLQAGGGDGSEAKKEGEEDKKDGDDSNK
ncbi:unnamed protein product [Ectocarpus sp. 13 AM-2016]